MNYLRYRRSITEKMKEIYTSKTKTRSVRYDTHIEACKNKSKAWTHALNYSYLNLIATINTVEMFN